jgi:hypothetical protein
MACSFSEKRDRWASLYECRKAIIYVAVDAGVHPASSKE